MPGSNTLVRLAEGPQMNPGHLEFGPDPQTPDPPPLWTPCGVTNATRAPRRRSTHKQNARKARKGRK